MGTVTTGDPNTEAAVTNSGTEQDAIFDFVIPRGQDGGAQPLELLTAYSTPPQPGTSGGALIFDRNGTTVGSAITHAENSADFIIQEPGYYQVSFHGTIGPASGVNFPLSILINLQQQGSGVAGTDVQHTFQTSSDVSNVAFSQIIEVTSVPSTLDVVGSGGSFLYSGISLSIYKLGNI